MIARLTCHVQMLGLVSMLLLAPADRVTAGEPPMLVINEIDYDQPGTDAAEFIEIKNIGCAPVNLSPYRLQLINGSGVIPTVYAQILLPNFILGPSEYFVVCGNAALTSNCDLDVELNENVIQNGAPDAILLVNIDSGTISDVVSYEGDVPGYTETSGATADSFSIAGSIGRTPDGVDTNHNFADFQFVTTITPGKANVSNLIGTCNGDINGDGTVNVTDLLAVINAWGACANPGNCPSDIAPPCGDDAVNVSDLLAVINAWGACT